MVASPREESWAETLGHGLAEKSTIPVIAGDILTPPRHQATMSMANGQKTMPRGSLTGVFSFIPRKKPENEANSNVAADAAFALRLPKPAPHDRRIDEQFRGRKMYVGEPKRGPDDDLVDRTKRPRPSDDRSRSSRGCLSGSECFRAARRAGDRCIETHDGAGRKPEAR